MEDSSFFLAHQIVADFESFLPGIAGDVTADSVHFGHGGREGTDTIHFTGADKDLNSNKSSRINRKERMKKTHAISLDHYLNKANEDELKTMGLMKVLFSHFQDDLDKNEAVWTHNLWKKLSGSQISIKKAETLVIIGSWKFFDLTDTEHFLCKLCLLCILAGVSRNYSDAPWCGSPHTHPRKPHLAKDDWDHGCIQIGLDKWAAFCKLEESKRRHSHHLTDTKAEHLSTKQLQRITKGDRPEAEDSKQKTPSRGNDTMATDSMGDSMTDGSGMQHQEGPSLGGKIFTLDTFDVDHNDDEDDSDNEEEQNLDHHAAQAQLLTLQEAMEENLEEEYDIEETMEGEDAYLEDTDNMMRLAFPDTQ